MDQADGLTEDAIKVIEAADSVWPVLALFMLGCFTLLWKYGSELIKNSRESRELAQQGRDGVKQISKYIVTNHGSTSLGNAIDRLTEWALEQRERSEEIARKVHSIDNRHKSANARWDLVSSKLDTYIEDNANLLAFTQSQLEQAMTRVDQTVSEVGKTVARVEDSVVRSNDRSNREGTGR